MNQNSGQNLNDLLKKLKHTVDSNETPTDTYVSTPTENEMSAEELQNELKNQFMKGEGVISPEDSEEYAEDSYKLDDEFLSEAQTETDGNIVTDEMNENIGEPEETEESEEPEEPEESEESEESEEPEETEDSEDDELPWEDKEENSDSEINVEDILSDNDDAPSDIQEDSIEKEPDVDELCEDENEIEDEERSESFDVGSISEGSIDEESEDHYEEEPSTDGETEKYDDIFASIERNTQNIDISEEIKELDEESYERYEDLDDEDLELVIDDAPIEDFSIWEDDEDLDGGDYDEDERYDDDIGNADEESTDTDEGGEIPNKPFIAVLRDNNITFERPKPSPSDDEAPTPLAVDGQDEATEDDEDVYREDQGEEDEEVLNEYFDEKDTTKIVDNDSENDESDDDIDVDNIDEAVDEDENSSGDSSTELLLQFGYNAHDENADRLVGFSPDRIRRIKRGYKKKHNSLRLTFLGCAAITLLMLFYEFLPLIGVEFAGFLNARYYPVSYALIGLQFLALCVALCWKKLWEGIKTLVSFKPDHNSIVAIAIIFTVIYDIVIAVCQYTSIPMMFNFLAALSLNLSVAVDLLLLKREMRIFDVYFADYTKYTSVTDGRKSSVAEKMYRGGLASSQSVFVPAEFTPTSTYFRSLDDRRETHKVIYTSALPCVVLALVIWMLGVFFDRGAVESVASAMTVLFSALPISIVLADALPLIISGARLYKRDIALMGVSSIRKFSDCNIMVFRDIHFFEKCEAQNTGMVFYDEGSAHIVFKCLNAVYSELGGPMANLFSRVTRADEAPMDVRFTRISANGTEAIVDGNKSILIGTPAFMKQYGLDFPTSEDQDSDERSLTLCVSLNGKVTAKISVKYRSAGIFEMLAEKLAAEGVFCAIETYDPLINSELINSERIFGDAPISVVHLNLGDLAREKYDELTENKMLLAKEPIGVVAGISRLKLAEALIWSKRIINTRKKCSRAIMLGSTIGALLSGLIFFFELGSFINQFWILIYQVLICAVSVLLTHSTIPPKDYFDIEAFLAQMTAEEESSETSEEISEEAPEECAETDDVEVKEEI